MKLAMEIFYDDEVDQWGYRVPALSIVGTGCPSREEAEQLGLEAIRFLIDADGQEFDGASEVVMFDFELTPSSAES